MAKEQTFSAKLKKDKDPGVHCSTCGAVMSFVKLVQPEVSSRTGAHKYRGSIVGICKCNEKEVWG